MHGGSRFLSFLLVDFRVQAAVFVHIAFCWPGRLSVLLWLNSIFLQEFLALISKLARIVFYFPIMFEIGGKRGDGGLGCFYTFLLFFPGSNWQSKIIGRMTF